MLTWAWPATGIQLVGTSFYLRGLRGKKTYLLPHALTSPSYQSITGTYNLNYQRCLDLDGEKVLLVHSNVLVRLLAVWRCHESCIAPHSSNLLSPGCISTGIFMHQAQEPK